MAVVVRSRRLVNPSRKQYRGGSKNAKKFLAKGGSSAGHYPQFKYKAAKSRARLSERWKKTLGNPTKKRRKLSPKQIAIFGTPRQKAALRAARSRKRNAGVNSVRKTKKSMGKGFSVKYPMGGSYAEHYKSVAKRTKARKARKRNIGEIVSISLAGLNPGRKKNTGMAKRRRATAHKHRVVRRKRVTTHRRKRATTVARRKRNPVYRVKRVARRRNAGTSNRMFTGVLGKAIGIIGGAVATRYATQAILGGNNVGVMGYLGNAVSAFALGWGTGKVAGKEMGTNVMIGGFVSTILRVITDQTSLGKYINLSLQGAGKGGDIGMGIIQDSSFPLPQVNVPGSQTQFIVPTATRNFVSSQIAAVRAATTKPGMGNVFGGQQRRRVM